MKHSPEHAQKVGVNRAIPSQESQLGPSLLGQQLTCHGQVPKFRKGDLPLCRVCENPVKQPNREPVEPGNQRRAPKPKYVPPRGLIAAAADALVRTARKVRNG